MKEHFYPHFEKWSTFRTLSELGFGVLLSDTRLWHCAVRLIRILKMQATIVEASVENSCNVPKSWNDELGNDSPFKHSKGVLVEERRNVQLWLS